MPTNYVNPNKVDPVTGGWKPPTVQPTPTMTQTGSIQGTMTTPQTPQAPQASPVQSGNFQSILGDVQNRLKYNNGLAQQRQLLIKHLFDSPLTPDQLAQLPKDIQNVVARGKDATELQIRVLNDEMQGRANSLDKSVQYLVNGYKDEQDRIEQQKKDAVNSVLQFVNAYGSNAGKAMRSLYGDNYMASLKNLGIDLENFAATPTIAEAKAKGTGTSTHTPGAIVDANGKPIKLTATQADTITGFDNTLGAADHALSLLSKGVQTGPIAGVILQGQKLIGTQDKDQLELEQTLAKLKADFMKAISGAAVSESEAKRLATFLPSISDQESVMKTKLETLKKESVRTKNNLLGTIGAVVSDTEDTSSLAAQVRAKGYDYERMKEDGYDDDEIRRTLGL